MPILIKKAGAYAAPVAIFVKKNGVYAAVQGAFAKVGGAYQSVLGAATIPVPTTLRTIESFNTIADNTNPYARYVYSEVDRTSLIIRNPAANTVSIELGFRNSDNIVNGNSDFSSKITLAPGQEMFSDNDTFQYWVRQNVTPAVANQTHEVERVITL
jgi:hypothetical protein